MLWAMAMIRYVYEPDFETTGLPKLFLTIFKSFILKRGKAQGYGLHSLDESKRAKFYISLIINFVLILCLFFLSQIDLQERFERY